MGACGGQYQGQRDYHTDSYLHHSGHMISGHTAETLQRVVALRPHISLQQNLE